ncbi:kinase-like domain-containing protein [Mycena pura]|uniref:Kinase-like domain-containing protein n=1 Tax=Mycena pura TaxID=153505 RepID=A0AAD6UYR2_9AGAR|nr:kinase-like domain-containing protein [Mycena pura]
MPLMLNPKRSNLSLDLSPSRRRASGSGRSTPPSIRPGHMRRTSSSRNSSDGRASAWLSTFTTTDSDPGSDFESPLGSPSSTLGSTGEWNFPSYNLSSHQLLLDDLDLTGTVNKSDKYPFESGGVADIYRGTVKSSTLQVAVKIFRRMHSDRETLERTSRHLYQEARTWRQLDHPNILPFLGISLDLGLSPALISPLCVSGCIMKYLQEAPKDPKGRLQMVIGVANGLAYLHAEGIVHGNFCTKKILINDDGLPVICGYGMSQAMHQPAYTASFFLASIRFASPECFSVKEITSSVRTTSGDVYAFSMVTLEILSGLQPYHHLPSEHAVFIHIVRGGRPVRTHLDPLAVTNGMWRFLTFVWNEEPSSRPEMPQVIRTLTRIRDQEDRREEEDYSSELESAENVGNLSSGSEASDSRGDLSLPEIDGRDLKGRITQDDQYPFAGGGNSNIYRGKLTRSNGRKIRVAIKMIRMSDDGSGHLEEVLRRLRREVDVWARLKHRNVLPFIGVCDDIAPWPVLISPFYKFGHVQTYLRKHPSTNRQNLVRGVASGLQYLHAHDIIHGDLKVQNVLVDKRGTPCICDFGISKIITSEGFTTASVGTAPYMAPELFFVVDGATQEEGSPSTTKCSDVYSFALLVLEILTSEPPKGRPTRPIISAKALADLQPKQSDYDEQKVTPEIWSVLNRCWAVEPHLRPPIFEVLRELKSIFQNKPVDSGGLENEFIRSVDGSNSGEFNHCMKNTVRMV